jgi:hypothetical protein
VVAVKLETEPVKVGTPAMYVQNLFIARTWCFSCTLMKHNSLHLNLNKETRDGLSRLMREQRSTKMEFNNGNLLHKLHVSLDLNSIALHDNAFCTFHQPKHNLRP